MKINATRHQITIISRVTPAPSASQLPDQLHSDKALAKTLEGARSQLPKNGLGAIFVKVPVPWLDDSQYLHSHVQVVEKFLRNTTRVQFVVLVWDEWIASSTGTGWRCEIGRRIFRSPNIAGAPEYLIDTYDKLWGTGIDILAPNAPF